VENYFNYFTEIEECFRRHRGTPTLLSTLDWALIESWKEGGIPLEAVLRGVERSFEKFKRRARKYRMVNSLAYCSQEVLRAAEELATERAEGAPEARAPQPTQPPLEADIRSFFARNAAALAAASELAEKNGETILRDDLRAAATTLQEIARMQADKQSDLNLEQLESHLATLEEKLMASLMRASSVDLLVQFRGEVERALIPYRRKMTAPQIESLERQFLKKRLFDHYQIPRLSLFYM